MDLLHCSVPDASQKVSLNAKQGQISTSDELLKQVHLRLMTGKEQFHSQNLNLSSILRNLNKSQYFFVGLSP